MPEILLKQAVRIFEETNPGSVLLRRTDLVLHGGDRVWFYDPVIKAYDHRDQAAMPFYSENQKLFYVLMDEMGLNPSMEKH